jgi:dimethylargininase
MVTRPGAPSRRGEVRPVAAALRPMFIERTERVAATIDGGDVLRDGEDLFVGLSERTNADGAVALAAVAARIGVRVVPVQVAAGLHLKSAVTLVAPGRLVALRGALDLGPFKARGARLIEVDEPAGGNVLALGRTVLVSAAAPATLDRLRAEPDVEPVAVDVSELHKGDGALTCLSLRTPPPGAWCA